MPRTPVALALMCLAVAAGCSNSRTAADPSRPAAPQQYRTLRFPAAGAAFSAPANWSVVTSRGPLIAVIGSGDAVISLWRYHRDESPSASIAPGRASLLRASYSHQPSARLLSTRVVRVDGAPAVEVDALRRLDGATGHVLSTHVYVGHSEVVLNEYAPTSLFTGAASRVFARVRRSLSVNGTSG